MKKILKLFGRVGFSDLKKCSKLPLEHSELALKKANFIVHTLSSLPERYSILSDIFRNQDEIEEFPRCSYKIIIKDTKFGDRISLKQFNYDWSPPAYGCPSLWANHVKFDYKLIPKPEHFIINGQVWWKGKNYKGQESIASIQNRTAIEVSCLDLDSDTVYTMQDTQELLHMAKSVEPLNLQAQKKLLDLSYADLSYKTADTISSPIVKVPISFWKCSLDNQLKYQIAYNAESIPDFFKKIAPSIPESTRHKLDTVFCYSSGNQKFGRFEYIYTDPCDKDKNIRILTWHKDQNHSVDYPPSPDLTQKFEHELVELGNQDVFVAYRNKKVGPFEAVWQNNQYCYMLLTKPDIDMGYDDAIDLIGDCVVLTQCEE